MTKRRAFFSVAVMAALLLALPRAALAQGAPTIVVYGDSLSAGFRLPRGQDYASQLQRALGRSARVVNRSRSGRTTAGGVRRLGSIPRDADGVILQLGGNDGLRGVRPAQVKANLARMLQRLRGRGLPVMLVGIGTLPRRGPAYAAQFRALYRDLARRYGAILVPDFLTGVGGNAALTLRDRIHPNPKGVAAMVRRTLPAARRLVARARRR